MGWTVDITLRRSIDFTKMGKRVKNNAKSVEKQQKKLFKKI